MPIYTLHRKQVVAMPLERVWKFFADPRNLKTITPPSLRLRMKTELPEAIYPGLMIEYTVSPLLGLPLTWLTEIMHVDEPNCFVDEQRVGPYRLWHHEHFFRRLDDEQVEVRDLIHYMPPLGPFGAVINVLAIRPQLTRIFAFRERALAEISCRAAIDSFT